MTAFQIGIACALALASSLSSCATTTDTTEVPDDPQYIDGALNSEQITLLVAGNTGYGEEAEYNWRTFFDGGGTISGRRWGDGFQETDSGTWEITEESHLCRQWQAKWGSRQRACFEVYKDGEAIKLINMDGNADSFQMMVVAGNRVEG